ncbi:Colanic acid biosynthesis glycosyl transferase WcaE [Microcystis aeruginosa NIES-2549]|uniref:Colanic acid biosynthesis glycosyl transferase WcaE n=1 Tax=Microcystis aeruginosa NIES-2549 TaxID=1641812 RepID=A0A0F6U4E3_MICAE|nr:glycosyltransferase family 2 protein [Microcystis aeruginosa]AKE64479.1 Colanic acid biosynthesis glycosyl transferase WcaE [Microcystis aeruginosa NIES-2549]
MFDPVSLVTVITPSYNRAWIISQCINSIKKQSYTNWEHIVVDAASKDNTVEILRNEETKYNLRWISEQDEGIYDAVNKGISLANGDIIAYLNTDDFYFPYTIETVVDVFNSTDADIVYGDWVNLYYPSANLELLPWMKLSKYDLLSDYNLPQPTVFIRRNVFEKIGNFNLDYTLVADNEFFTRAALAGFKLVKIEEVLAGQTIHQNNLLAGNSSSRVTALEEGIKYRQYYQKLYKISSLYLLLLRLKNRLLFRINADFKIVQFFFSYSGEKPHCFPEFSSYLKTQKISFSRIKMIKYLIINLLFQGRYNKSSLVFIQILDGFFEPNHENINY